MSFSMARELVSAERQGSQSRERPTVGEVEELGGSGEHLRGQLLLLLGGRRGTA